MTKVVISETPTLPISALTSISIIGCTDGESKYILIYSKLNGWDIIDIQRTSQKDFIIKTEFNHKSISGFCKMLIEELNMEIFIFSSFKERNNWVLNIK